MKTRSLLAFIILLAVSCDEEDAVECRLQNARSGYKTGQLTYYYDYRYTFDADRLVSMDQLDINTNENLSSTSFEYDSKGRLSRETIVTNGALSYRSWKYSPRSLKVINESVVSPDLSAFIEEQFFYVENPQNKIYHDTFNKTSLKFQEGNLVEYGVYQVSGGDTTDVFYERYSYDNNENYFKSAEYRSAIPFDYMWAKVVSKNNLIHAEYTGAGGGFSYDYTYKYEGDRLIEHVGKSGIIINFEYDCR